MAFNFFNNKARAAALAAGKSAAPKDAKQENTRLQPWVEKYRPKTLDDVAAQDHTVAVLQRTLQASNLPHMLFYGPPGTGKTSTILALSKSLFGPSLYRSRILELNASDERGINIVREKIKDFARTQLSHPPSDLTYTEKYPCPPFKIIILDEADSMTQDAQSALRRTMERYSRITRFCLVCNYVTRIIDPVASRCSKFRFKTLDGAAAAGRLEEIIQEENLLVDDGVLDCLLKSSEGDLRRAITYLQSAARLVGAVSGGGSGDDIKKKKKSSRGSDEDTDMDTEGGDDQGSDAKTKRQPITVQIVEEIAGIVPAEIINELSQAAQPSKTHSAYNAVAKVTTGLVADGWSASQVLSQLYQSVIFNESILDLQKNELLAIFSETDRRLVDGADEHLTVLDLVLRIAEVLKRS
ncbi:hypothetical protein KEM54_002344 [Ascosphaera aggregata]|nr:hypothetical protein KEM54_002344 [Ascosphaera aggregata]